MKILLDHSAPLSLARYLTNHEVRHTSQLGWTEVSNGDLLRLAEESGYWLMITADKNIPWQNSLSGRLIGILTLSTNNWPLMKPYVSAIVEAVETAQIGQIESVFCGRFVPQKFQKTTDL